MSITENCRCPLFLIHLTLAYSIHAHIMHENVSCRCYYDAIRSLLHFYNDLATFIPRYHHMQPLGRNVHFLAELLLNQNDNMFCLSNISNKIKSSKHTLKYNQCSCSAILYCAQCIHYYTAAGTFRYGTGILLWIWRYRLIFYCMSLTVKYILKRFWCFNNSFDSLPFIDELQPSLYSSLHSKGYIPLRRSNLVMKILKNVDFSVAWCKLFNIFRYI